MRIKEKRIENKMTQGQVAEAVGISQGLVSHYEIGRRQPRIDMLKKLSRLFKCTVDELIGGDDDPR